MTDRQNEEQRTRAQHEIRKLIERNAVALQHQQQQVAAAAAAAAAASRTTPPSTPSGGGGAGLNGIGSGFHHGAPGALGGGPGGGESKVCDVTTSFLHLSKDGYHNYRFYSLS